MAREAGDASNGIEPFEPRLPFGWRRSTAVALLVFSLAAKPAVLCAAEPVVGGAVSGPANLDELLGAFAESGVVRARVVETRRLALLAEPVVTEGLLYFAPPDRLARYTSSPGRSRVVVDGTRVAFEDETGHRRMDLRSSDVARGLIDNLIVLLRGDMEQLRARYVVSFSMHENTWQLDLEPRTSAVRALIENTAFRGRGFSLVSMETVETAGDRSFAAFSEVESGLELDRAELDRIFSLEPTPGGVP